MLVGFIVDALGRTEMQRNQNFGSDQARFLSLATGTWLIKRGGIVEIVPCAQFRLVFQNLGPISLHGRRPVVHSRPV